MFRSRIFLALLIVVIILRTLISGLTFEWSNALVQNLILIGALILAAAALREGRISLLKTPIDVPLTLLFIFILLSIFRSVNLNRSVLFFYHFFAAFLLFYLVVNAVKIEKTVILLLSVMVAVAVIVSLYGIFQYFIGFDITREYVKAHPGFATGTAAFQSRLESNKVFSTFVYSNALAGYLLMLFPVTAGLFFTVSFKKRLWLFLALLLQLYALFLTRSKAGLGILLVLIIVYTALYGFVRGWEFLKGHSRRFLILFLLLLVLGGSFLAVNSGFREAVYKSLEVRIDYWKAAVQMIKSRPLLGFGPDCFGSVYAKYKLAGAEDVQLAHNNYIQMWTDSGIFAFLAFLYLWVVFLAAGWKLIKSTRVPEHQSTSKKKQKKAQRAHLPAGRQEDTKAERKKENIRASALGGHQNTCDKIQTGAQVHWCTGALSIGLYTGVIAFLLHSLVDFGLYVPGILINLIVIMGLFVAMTRLALPAQYSEIVFRIPCKAFRNLTACFIVAAVLIFSAGTLRPMIARRYYDTALFCLGQKQRHRAQRHLRFAIKYNPICALYHHTLASVYQSRLKITFDEAGLTKKTIEEYKEAIKHNPYRPYYHYALGKFYLDYRAKQDKKFLPLALKEWQQASALYHTKPFYHQQLAELYELLGRKDDTSRERKTAKELPVNPSLSGPLIKSEGMLDRTIHFASLMDR